MNAITESSENEGKEREYMNDNTYTAVVCHMLVELLDKVEYVGVNDDGLKLGELEPKMEAE